MKLFSPAKVNFFFRVLAKRGDGYHDIASLYSTLNYGDFLHITLAERDSFTCSDSRLGNEPTNLVLRALQLFRREGGSQVPLAIHLEKHIPMQAGLGGGSSNAATILWGLNELLEKPFSLEELRNMGSILGSDVPFFFSSGSAYCEGRGEICEDVPFSTEQDIWIAVPHFLCSSTPVVYGDCHPAEMSAVDPRVLLGEFLREKFSCVNDLQPAAFRQVPGLEAVYKDLCSSFVHVALTGSGSAFYAIGKKAGSLPTSCTYFTAKVITRNSGEWYCLPSFFYA